MSPADDVTADISGDDRVRWQRRAWWLVIVALAYNLAEAVVALAFGVIDDSVVLFGFGLDSVVEVCAGAAILWRLNLERRGASGARVESAERRVGRFVGLTLLVLACYVGMEAGIALWFAERPQASAVGIALAVASVAVMPAVAWGKFRAAAALQSEALRAEATETLACSYLSVTLLLGLAANAAAGWWWADPVAALLMVPWLLKEGVENVRGEDGD